MRRRINGKPWISAAAVAAMVAGLIGAGAILTAPIDESQAAAKPAIEWTVLPASATAPEAEATT